MNEESIIDLLKSEIKKERSVKGWSIEHGVSESYVWHILHGRAKPGFMIIKALKLKKIVTYVQES